MLDRLGADTGDFHADTLRLACQVVDAGPGGRYHDFRPT